MIKAELHIHSLGGSYCAQLPAKEIVKRYKQAGYGALMLTNHYSKRCFGEYPVSEFKDKVDYFFSLFDEFKNECDKVGIKAFCGVEVAVMPFGTDYVLVGFDKAFLYENKPLYDLTQEELFALAEKDDIFMYQAHPFRLGSKVGNPKFMHGAECFNGHFHHNNYNAIAEKFCKENNLVRLSGNDFHAVDEPIIGGVFIPNYVNDEKALAKYLKSGKCKILKDELYYQQCTKEFFERERQI